MKQPSPMDMADQKMLNDIVLLIVGGIGGVMGRKSVKAAAEMIAAVKAPVPPQVATFPPQYGMQPQGMPNYQGFTPMQQPVVFNNNWTPPPPPSIPPCLEDDEEIDRDHASFRGGRRPISWHY